jgi:hypothetical protein
LTRNRHSAFLNSICLASIVGAAAVLCGIGLDSAPQVADAQPNFSRAPDIRPQGSAQVTASSTFATTSFADLPGSSVTVNPIVDPNSTNAPVGTALGTLGYPLVHEHIYWSLDVTKATATTGTCGLYINGALVTRTERTINYAAGEGTMGGYEDIVNTTTGSQTVKIQCKSGDTDTFTVNNGTIYVEEVF